MRITKILLLALTLVCMSAFVNECRAGQLNFSIDTGLVYAFNNGWMLTASVAPGNDNQVLTAMFSIEL